MNWAKGYSSTYYMSLVDPVTWRDIERYEITGGSVKRTADGLMESADIECGKYPEGIENWIRVWLDTKQAGSSDHVALFTGLATSPGRDLNGRIRKSELECYSVLKPADDVKLLRGWYAPAGAAGGEIIKELLSVTPAPVVIEENSPALIDHVIAEGEETHLTMVWKVLTAINWTIRISGSGTIKVMPISSDPVATFDPLENDILETEIKIDEDWFECPNVYVAIQDDLTAIARDNDPQSKLSIENRGREVWTQESGVKLAASETLAEYAQRRLKEAQRIQVKASYDRRYVPDVFPGDKIRLHYPEQGLDGVFTVDSQSIEIAYSARTSEDITTEA